MNDQIIELILLLMKLILALLSYLGEAPATLT